MARREERPVHQLRPVTVLFLTDAVIHDYPEPPKTLFKQGQIEALRPSSAQFWITRDVATDDPELIAAARAKAEKPKQEPAPAQSHPQQPSATPTGATKGQSAPAAGPGSGKASDTGKPADRAGA